MATVKITDGKPQYWDFKGGRHNSMLRYKGEKGLWYLVETRGQGRYMDGWALHVFPNSIPAPSYKGRKQSVVLNETFMSHCLLSISGSGGHDFGKSVASKGGYRKGGPIQYSFSHGLVKKVFSGGLLDDGDEFLRQVLGYEPTPEGVIAGAARDKARTELELAEARAEEQAQKETRAKEWQAKEAARAQATAKFEEIFEGARIPPEFKHRISSRGLEVYRDRGESFSDSIRWYDRRTLTSIDEHLDWLQEAEDTLHKEATERAHQEEEKKKREAEQAQRAEQIAAEQAAIEGDLDNLTDLLSSL